MTDIPDAAVEAFLASVVDNRTIIIGHGQVRAGLAAAWPHLAAAALRDAADDLAPEAVERVDLMPVSELAARSVTAGWLRRRADELEGGTGQEGHAT